LHGGRKQRERHLRCRLNSRQREVCRGAEPVKQGFPGSHGDSAQDIPPIISMVVMFVMMPVMVTMVMVRQILRALDRWRGRGSLGLGRREEEAA
jgi:hypothetical protein